MGGVVRGIGRAIGGVVRGVGSAVGGVVKGVGYLAQGRLDKAVGSVVGGVVKGAGYVLKGGLGAVKDVLGDPIVGIAAGVGGFMLGGPLGAAAGLLLAKGGSKLAGGLEKGVGHLFGLNQPQYQQLGYGQNLSAFGPYNAHMGAMPGGLYPPFFGSGFGSPFTSGLGMNSPFGYGMPRPYGLPMQYPPTYNCCPCTCRFA